MFKNCLNSFFEEDPDPSAMLLDIDSEARRSWSRKSPGGPWQVGVEFLDITEDVQTKILDLLLRRIYLEEEARP